MLGYGFLRCRVRLRKGDPVLLGKLTNRLCLLGVILDQLGEVTIVIVVGHGKLLTGVNVKSEER